MSPVNVLLTGAIASASLTAALFFLKFWYRTHDRFFGFFSMAFAIEAVNRFALGLALVSESDNVYFLIRFVSYAVIILAITDKNWRGKF